MLVRPSNSTRQLTASNVRPVRELKGFMRLGITIRAADLRFWNSRGEFLTEPREFHVWIAPGVLRGVPDAFRLE